MPALTVMIKPVSSACNMRCKYCFYSDVAKNREHASMGRMTYETLEALVRKAMRYAEGQITFAFQGGEPTLAGVEFYEKLIQYQKRYNAKGVRVQNSIQTNGYALSEELLELFAREHFLVGVSFDGSPEIHDKLRIDVNGNGTSASVEQTIRRLEEKNVEFNILCVVNEYVAQHARETFQYLQRYGYIQYIACLDPFDGEKLPYSLTQEAYTAFLKETFDLYYKAFRKGRYVSVRNFDNYISILMGREPENCAMRGRCAQYYLLEADGGVYPCDFYVLDQWRMGNVNEDSFFKLAKSPVAAQFLQDSLHVSEECKTCRWYRLCRGGCRRDREPFMDGHPILNKWCSCYREFFEYSIDRMMEMARSFSGQ